MQGFSSFGHTDRITSPKYRINGEFFNFDFEMRKKLDSSICDNILFVASLTQLVSSRPRKPCQIHWSARTLQEIAPVHSTSTETQGQLIGAEKSLNGREKNSGEEKSKALDFPIPEFFSRIFSLLPLTAPGSPRMGPSIAGNRSRYNLCDIVTTFDVWRIPKLIICAVQALILKCKH